MARVFARAAFAVAAAVSCLQLSGCSMLAVGEEEFACSGMPGSPYCASARDVYEATNDGSVPSPLAKGEAYNAKCTNCGRNGATAANSSSTPDAAKHSSDSLMGDGGEVVRNYVSPAIPGRPIPVRTPAQVMRIWIAPYVDKAGDLIAPGFVYTEIEARKWIYPDALARSGSRSFTPLASTRRYWDAVNSSNRVPDKAPKSKGKKNAQVPH